MMMEMRIMDYKDLEYHLWYICQYYGMLRPHSMRSLIQNYCFTHRYEALAAYQCTTGCPLADHINQICMRMFTPLFRKPQTLFFFFFIFFFFR
nr:hypothetical protein BaRGS_014345 [Batillaria attramentaria]